MESAQNDIIRKLVEEKANELIRTDPELSAIIDARAKKLYEEKKADVVNPGPKRFLLKQKLPTLEQLEQSEEQSIINKLVSLNHTVHFKHRFYDGEKFTFKPKVHKAGTSMMVASGIEYHFSYRKQTNDFEYNGQYYQTPFHIIIKTNKEHEIQRQVEKEADAKAKFTSSQERIKEQLMLIEAMTGQQKMLYPNRGNLRGQLMDYEKYKLLHTPKPPTPQVKCRMSIDEAMRRRDANEKSQVAIFDGKVKKIGDDWRNNCYVTRDGVTIVVSKIPHDWNLFVDNEEIFFKFRDEQYPFIYSQSTKTFIYNNVNYNCPSPVVTQIFKDTNHNCTWPNHLYNVMVWNNCYVMRNGVATKINCM